MNTPQPIPCTAVEGETYSSEFLLNRAKMAKRRKGFIVRTEIKNPDGSYTVTWTPAPSVINFSNGKGQSIAGKVMSKGRIAFDIEAYPNSFSVGCRM